MIHKIFIPIMLLAGALCFAGCVEERNDLEDGGSSDGGSYSGGGGSSSGSGSSAKTFDFWTDDCAAMGGQTLSSGACYIKCNSDDDCKNIRGASRCQGTLRPSYCIPESCNNKPGWHYNISCKMTCSGKNDTTTCPPERHCAEADTKTFYFCGYGSSSGSSGGGSSYCAQLGCGGIFCSGKCIGCPGC